MNLVHDHAQKLAGGQAVQDLRKLLFAEFVFLMRGGALDDLLPGESRSQPGTILSFANPPRHSNSHVLLKWKGSQQTNSAAPG